MIRPLVTFHQKSNGSMLARLWMIQIRASGAMTQRWRRRSTRRRPVAGASEEAGAGGEVLSAGAGFRSGGASATGRLLLCMDGAQHGPLGVAGEAALDDPRHRIARNEQRMVGP